MTPPTLISTTVSTNFANAGVAQKNTPATVSWLTGDLLTCWGFCGDTIRTLTDPPTATGLTFSKLLDSAIAARGQLYLWTATAGSAGTNVVVNSTLSANEEGGIVVKVYRGASGFGTVSSLGSGTSGAPSVAYTISAIDSVVDGGGVEFNNNTNARTYLTTNLGAATEDHEYNSATYATSWTWHNAGTTATGSQSIGLSAPTMAGWLVAGIEVLGTSGVPSAVAMRRDFESARIGPF